ncbi:uncharacterized protein ARMOST_21765 [Armillaria ostoyae]|uniref:Uncharacterized protein n=1 Tax=Armillaria ostoyae TaxID=47428 RepID=A0A284SAY8_ARMOS|nr:uncharacterized protein ARMOST_21765 [Armillaria ostoyae]
MDDGSDEADVERASTTTRTHRHHISEPGDGDGVLLPARRRRRLLPSSDDEDDRHREQRRRLLPGDLPAGTVHHGRYRPPPGDENRENMQETEGDRRNHDMGAGQGSDQDARGSVEIHARRHHNATDVSLHQFIDSAELLRRTQSEAECQEDYLRYVLCGEHSEDQYINLSMTGAELPVEHAELTRDYDSIIAICDRIPELGLDFECVVTHQTRKAMQGKVGVRVPFQMRNPETGEVSANTEALKDPGSVPNVYLGKLGHHCAVYLLLPNLAQSGNNETLPVTVEQYKIIYEAFRETSGRLEPMIEARNPPTYTSKAFSAGIGISRTIREMTELIRGEAVGGFMEDFSETLVRKAEEWGAGHRFLIQWRGIKMLTAHDPQDEPGRCTALRRAIGADPQVFSAPGNDVFVDVALELAVKGGAVLWRSDGHAVALQKLFAVHRTTAQQFTRFGYSNYHRDTCAHLTAIAGCHITSNSKPLGPYRASFLQLYTTDKSLTYDMRTRNNAKFVTTEDLMKKPPDNLTYNMFMTQIHDMFTDTAESNDVHARIEARVPLEKAKQVLAEAKPEDFEDLVYCHRREDWWQFKATRIQGFASLVKWQNEELDMRVRVQYGPVLLTSLVTFMVNSIYARPEERSGHKELMRAVWPRTSSPGGRCMILPCSKKIDGTEEPGPYAEGGCWWIPGTAIEWPGYDVERVRIPQCEGSIRVRSEAAWDLLGPKETFEAFCSPDRHAKRQQSSVARRGRRQVRGPASEGQHAAPLPETESHPEQTTISPAVRADLAAGDRMHEEVFREHSRISLHQLLQHMVSDYMLMAGETKDRWKHVRMAQEERRRTDIGIMQEPDLGGVFTHARTIQDNRLRRRPVKELQSLKNVEGVRTALKKGFDQLLWCVWSDGRRVYIYSKTSGELIHPHGGDDVASMSAVRLIRNPNPAFSHKRFIMTLGHQPALRNDEEDGEVDGEEAEYNIQHLRVGETVQPIEREALMQERLRQEELTSLRREEEESSEEDDPASGHVHGT